jgi:signal transduction histidine kinase
MNTLLAPAESALLADMHALTTQLAVCSDLADVLAAVVGAARAQFGYEQATIHLTETATRELALCAVADPLRVSAAVYHLPWEAETVPCQVLAMGRPVRVDNFETEPHVRPAVSLQDRSELSVPIRNGATVVGALTVTARHPAAFTAQDESLLEIMAGQLSVAVHSDDLLRRETERGLHERLLTEIGLAINSSLKLEEVLQQAVVKIGEGLKFDRCVLGFCDLVQQRFVTEHEYLTPLFVERRSLKGVLPLRQGWAPLIDSLRAGQVVAADEESAPDALQTLWRQWMQRLQLKSMLWVPVLGPAPEAEGFYCLQVFQVTHNRRWTESEIRLLEAIAAQLAVAVRNAHLFDVVQRSVQAVRAKSDEMEAFVYSVSHDLQAPVVSLRGFASLLQKRADQQLDTHSRNYVTRIIANAEYLAQLLGGLLELSRVGRVEEPSQPVAVGDVVQQMLTAWAPIIGERQLRVDQPQQWPVVLGSRTRLRQVFENLFSNAVKFMGPQPAPTITLGWQALPGDPRHGQPAMFEFSVRDNGVGIPADAHERIFRTFERLNPTATEGTGIGLSIVKRIVEGAGGRIRVSNQQAEGVTFWFSLPAAGTQVEDETCHVRD